MSNQCYQKCCHFCSLCRWTNFSRSPPWKRYSRLPVLPLCLSRTEQWGVDIVPQPDLYSGQAVYYIKKVMGLCKSTCSTFLQNFLKPSTTSECQIRLAVGRGEEVCAQTLPSPQSFKGCFHCSCPHTPLSTQLILQYIFLYRTCLISSCVIPDGTFWKFNPLSNFNITFTPYCGVKENTKFLWRLSCFFNFCSVKTIRNTSVFIMLSDDRFPVNTWHTATVGGWWNVCQTGSY